MPTDEGVSFGDDGGSSLMTDFGDEGNSEVLEDSKKFDKGISEAMADFNNSHPSAAVYGSDGKLVRPRVGVLTAFGAFKKTTTANNPSSQVAYGFANRIKPENKKTYNVNGTKVIIGKRLDAQGVPTTYIITPEHKVGPTIVPHINSIRSHIENDKTFTMESETGEQVKPLVSVISTGAAGSTRAEKNGEFKNTMVSGYETPSYNEDGTPDWNQSQRGPGRVMENMASDKSVDEIINSSNRTGTSEVVSAGGVADNTVAAQNAGMDPGNEESSGTYWCNATGFANAMYDEKKEMKFTPIQTLNTAASEAEIKSNFFHYGRLKEGDTDSVNGRVDQLEQVYGSQFDGKTQDLNVEPSRNSAPIAAESPDGYIESAGESTATDTPNIE